MNECIKLHGKYRGIVANPVDPGNKGRITATVTVGGTPVPVVCEASALLAGPGVGIFAAPPPGSGVWIEFEDGDFEKPVWTGGWWPEGELPLSFATAGSLATLPIIIQSLGYRIVLGDPTGALKLESVVGPPGPQIVLDKLGITLSYAKSSIKIDAKGVSINGTNLVVLP